MAVQRPTTQEPEVRLDPEYVRQRRADPDMKVRDVGEAIAEVIHVSYGRPAREHGLDLALDSGVVSETLGERLLEELERMGYAVTFRAPGGTHR